MRIDVSVSLWIITFKSLFQELFVGVCFFFSSCLYLHETVTFCLDRLFLSSASDFLDISVSILKRPNCLSTPTYRHTPQGAGHTHPLG